MTNYVRVHGHNYYMPYEQGLVFFADQYHKTKLEPNDTIVGEYDPDRKVIHPVVSEAVAVVGKKGQTLDSLLFGAKLK